MIHSCQVICVLQIKQAIPKNISDKYYVTMQVFHNTYQSFNFMNIHLLCQQLYGKRNPVQYKILRKYTNSNPVDI